MGPLKYIDKAFDFTMCALAVIASATIVLALSLLVILRFFFGISITGMHEASLFAAIWLYMSGAIIVMRRKEHLVIDVLHNSISSEKLKNWHDLFINLLILVIACFFSTWAWKMLEWGMLRPQTIPILNLPLWLAQLPIALAAIAAIIYSIRDIARSITNIHKKRQER